MDKVGGEKFLSNKKIRLSDLVWQDSIIRDRTIEDCEISRPMVVNDSGWFQASIKSFDHSVEGRADSLIGTV